MAQHRAQRHTMRWVLLGVGLFLALMYWHGDNVRTKALTECMPGVTPHATGSMHFNPCATLDTTQVQDRRTPTPSVTSDEGWPMATDTLYVCTEEDGSEPGQPFPCLWEAPLHGNHTGMSYVLTSAQGVWPQ